MDAIQQVSVQKPAASPAGGQAAAAGGTPLPPSAVSEASRAAVSKAVGEAREASRVDLDAVVEQLNAYTQNLQRSLQFSVDDSTGRSIIRIMDRETQELIRQIPSDEILAISRHIEQLIASDDTRGLLISDLA